MSTDNIGQFQVLRELGRGGMGEVYLARDSRLDRQVAIKALPEHLAADSDRLTRFQREAKVLASLNHANIGAIYGVEEAAGRQYLILEFVEGQTLHDRLARGAIPSREALEIALQIARALEAAHEKGIVHRDLKPANIMISAEDVVKVLDFGLARTIPFEPTSSNALPADSPTVAMPTIPGAILGTAGYMSPEQALGKPVDKRSDIFSFGCVLYEMLTGRGPFPGETVTDSLGAILHRDPEWTRLPAETPAHIRELLANCLVKDRKNRLHDMGDARLAIEHAGTEVTRSARRTGAVLAGWGVAALAVAGAAAAWLLRPAAPAMPEPQVVRFTIPPPPGVNMSPDTINGIISPDGRRLVFIASEPGHAERLWVRELDSVTSHSLEGTEAPITPFWSPDSRTIAFFANGQLCKISAEGGPVQRIADAPGGRGGDWNDAGVILFAPSSSGPLHIVPQSGGVSTPVTEVNPKLGETGHRFPQFLPGGRTFLYASIRPDSVDKSFTIIGSLDSKETHEVCIADSRATYAPGDWLLIERAKMLYAKQFDPAAGATLGDEFPTGIRADGWNSFAGRSTATCSRTGIVTTMIDGLPRADCVEVGPDGKIIRTLSIKPEVSSSVGVSPDGSTLATMVAPIPNTAEVRVIGLAANGVWSRVIDDPRTTSFCWSGDGHWVYYSIIREGRDIFRRSVDGLGTPEFVYATGNTFMNPLDVSADGRLVIFNTLEPDTRRNLWIYDTQTKTRRALANGPSSEFDARLSPDGRLIAIASDETGEPQLFVQDFPDAKARIRVSLAGMATDVASDPGMGMLRWSKDGSAIMFLDADWRTVRSAAISTTPTLRAGKPEPIMHLPEKLQWVDFAPDGKSAFALCTPREHATASISVTLNWQAALGTSATNSSPRP